MDEDEYCGECDDCQASMMDDAEALAEEMAWEAVLGCEPSDEIRQAATQLRQLHIAYLEVGFSRGEALTLVMALLQRGAA